jgi:SAM-dependent methyltransferase
MSAAEFYDALAPFYHLVYADWEASIGRQAQVLAATIRSAGGPQLRTVLDAACGAGTQSLGLAALGFDVTASDISSGALARARGEAERRGLRIDFTCADMRAAFEHHRRTFDVVLAADNSVPHLLTEGEILQAFRQFHACTAPGGLTIISVRDYAGEDQKGTVIKPHGVHVVGGTRHVLFQVWEWRPPLYDMSFYVVEDDGGAGCRARVMRTTYHAVSIDALMALLGEAGFEGVERIDGAFFQPLIIGRKAAAPRG